MTAEGKSPDPGIKPGGGCMCTLDGVPDRDEIVADIVAAAFHDTYERLAPEHGYATREGSRKPWGQVPENNRNLMRATVRHLLDEGIIRAGR